MAWRGTTMSAHPCYFHSKRKAESKVLSLGSEVMSLDSYAEQQV